MKGTLQKHVIKSGHINKGGQWVSAETYYQPCPAVLYQGLAVHFETSGALPWVWIISHAASGLAIARFCHRRNAFIALKALAPLYDWHRVTTETLPADAAIQVDMAIGYLLESEAMEDAA